ncbi:MAG: hypothetical protein RJB08_1398 [Actinomycetota bacterium]|jgi:DNA-binding NarL/FixJ family response regulator
MTSVVLVFKEPYATVVFGPLRSTVKELTILAVASEVSTAVEAMAEHSPHALVIGPSFVAEIPALTAGTSDATKPVIVLMVLEADALLMANAVAQGVDFVVLVEGGVEESLKSVARLLSDSDSVDSRSIRDSETPKSFGLIHIRDDVDRRIVELIAEGHGDREICDAVFLSHQTVRNRISRILFEADVRNRTHLATMYLRNIHAGVSPFAQDPRRTTGPT